MAGKTPQYELLANPVVHSLEIFDNSGPPTQTSPDVQRSSDHAVSRNGFPAQVFKATRASKATFLRILMSHLVVTGVLVTTIVLGATKRTYAIGEDAHFLGISLSVDNQMFLFGLFNKVADYVLNDSIGRVAGVLLTVWMSGTTRFPGVLPLDFELSEEMSKPWRSILNAVQRWKLDPPQNKSISIVRIVATFASGMTVLLLGGSFNVIALPKLRWTGRAMGSLYTDIGFFFEIPTTRIDNINWSNLDDRSIDLFGTDVSTSQQLSLGNTIAAVSLLDVLGDLVPAINAGSTRPSQVKDIPAFVNIYTIQRARQTQSGVKYANSPLAVRGNGQTNANLSTEATLSTLSIQEGPIYDFWTDGNHTIYATQALGARNWFNLTLPMISTTCAAIANDSGSQDLISAPQGTSSPTFAVTIPGNGTVYTMQCSLTVQQAVFPIWVYNSTNDARGELTTPIAHPEYFMKYLAADQANAAIATSLSTKLNATIPYLEQATGVSFIDMATSLRSSIMNKANSTYIGSTNVATNLIIGSLAQHLVTIATWEESDSGERHLLGPMQFQLYGSGPRADWQWIIAIILGLAIMVLGYDMFLMSYRRIVPGPWLSVPGMMIAANSASSLNTSADRDDGAAKVGTISEEVERTRYCFASVGNDGLVEISRLDARKRMTYPYAGGVQQ